MLTDTEFETIKRKIRLQTGIELSVYKTNFLKRKIESRIFETHSENFKEYLIFLNNQQEQNALLKSVSINVTEFFRDISLFEELNNNIFPELINLKKQNKSKIIRVWSAGCASGEEPYSVAIILKEIFEEHPVNFILSITATDIDEKALQKAKQGIFPVYRIKNLKQKHIEKYFIKLNEKALLINPSLKENIRFLKHNLTSSQFPTNFDVILCRNVPIYFSREMQESLFSKFHSSLNKNGLLILGKSETIMTDIKEKFLLYNLDERIYKKIG